MKRIGIACLLLLATPAARAEWSDLTGQEAPSFEVTKWFNQADGLTLGDFRGKAVLVEFWATW